MSDIAEIKNRQTYSLLIKSYSLLIKLLLCAFIALKLGIIPGNPIMNWSWFFVLSPLWLPLVSVLFYFVVFVVYLSVTGQIDSNGNRLIKVKDSKDSTELEDSTEPEDSILLNTFTNRELDIDDSISEGSIFTPVVVEKKKRPKKPPLFQRFKTWYVEGNKKHKEKKLEKKNKTS